MFDRCVTGVQNKLFSVSFYSHSPFLLAAGGENDKVVIWETDSVSGLCVWACGSLYVCRWRWLVTS